MTNHSMHSLASKFNSSSHKMDTNEKKSKKKHPPPFSIRFTDDERTQLDKAAGTLSLAAYIRLKLFCDETAQPTKRNSTRKKQSPSAELAMIGHILGSLGQSRLSSNLNQIAKGINQGTLPATPELETEIIEACAAIKRMRDELIIAMGIKSK